MFNNSDQIFNRLFFEERSANEIRKTEELYELVNYFFRKVYDYQEDIFYELLHSDYCSLGYLKDIGYYAVEDMERGQYSFPDGLPCQNLNKAFSILVNGLLKSESIEYEYKNKEKLVKESSKNNGDYNSLVVKYEYILDKWYKYYDGNIPNDIIKEYENKLNNLELNNINYKYNKKTKKIDVITNDKIRKEKLEELKYYLEELKTIKFEERKITKPFVTTTGYNYYLNNGTILPREKISKNGNDGSAVIIVPEVNGEYLTVIEPRVFTRYKVAVGFPAGYIEKGENPKLAALRELREETGYVSENLIELDSYYQDEGISSAYNHIFYAKNCKKEYDQNLDEDEVIRYMLFNYEELLELERMGYLNGANSKLALTRIKKIKE